MPGVYRLALEEQLVIYGTFWLIISIRSSLPGKSAMWPYIRGVRDTYPLLVHETTMSLAYGGQQNPGYMVTRHVYSTTSAPDSKKPAVRC
jgi:hypothetical protein